jgi:hypothetical protein
MRTVVTFAVLGLSLGLAAQMLPRVLERDASVLVDGTPMPLSSKRSGSATPLQGRASEVPPGPEASGTSASREAAPADHESGAEEGPFGTHEIGGDTPAPGGRSSEDTAQAIERLRAAGFSAERARELIGRESQLRDQAVKAEYAATGTLQAFGGPARSLAGQQLRKELGDDVYETYRRATGQPTRVRIGDVESDSVAANAGLLSGDEILSYAGRRVFDSGELNAMMLKTSIGETVPMVVVRNGQRLQLYVTGGALGISQRGVR